MSIGCGGGGALIDVSVSTFPCLCRSMATKLISSKGICAKIYILYIYVLF